MNKTLRVTPYLEKYTFENLSINLRIGLPIENVL